MGYDKSWNAAIHGEYHICPGVPLPHKKCDPDRGCLLVAFPMTLFHPKNMNILSVALNSGHCAWHSCVVRLPEGFQVKYILWQRTPVAHSWHSSCVVR